MKYIIFTFLLVSFFPSKAIDGAETILPKTKIIKTTSWYADQAKRWEEKVRQEPSNAAAWLNYYSASRYAQSSLADLDRISSRAVNTIAGSFEAKVVQALNEGYSEKAFNLLLSAYEMNPGQATTYGPLLLAHEFRQNESERKNFSKRLLSSGVVSQSLMSYSYNVLMSLEDNAMLFTEGENTTLPLFILQDVLNVRKDVTILDLDLLVKIDYRDQKLKLIGLNFLSTGPFTEEDSKKALCAFLPEQNSSKKFYYALTLARENISSIDNQLYVVGLASQISKERLNNIALIKENLEKRFLMDYLLVDFNGESEFSAGKVLSSNYLISMLLLNEEYLKSGEIEKAKRLQQLFTKIANETGKSTLVDNFLDRERKMLAPVALIDIGVKDLDGQFRLIKDNLYANHEEVTNGQYNLFLDYLKKNNITDVLDKSKIDLSQYDATSLAFFKGYHTFINPVVKSRGKSNYQYKNYPVVNISHEGAIAYCDWLTEQYNASADRKFKKVKFRLPTLKEWQISALGYREFQSWNLYENKVKVVIPKTPTTELFKGDETVVQVDNTILYPWFRSFNYKNKAQNSKNCWLGNFKIPEDCKPCLIRSIGGDGFSMMSSCGAYFPNDMGLYDVVGNVAEMIDEDGKACGGSWDQSPEESTIQSVSEYKGPGATIGFRVFMEVIEK